ncbi:BPI fold-containing family B member 2 [Microcaecilia unicolor]|uniref:BPI fold-containing family B member 2-like n=1 Tax=Microcaecilia unicolor TaxID=1415580 RepID=A0A6P7YWJ9_9AMPH|nr:BPI fold-containing family B member 2-like [Microcaecilia unicolor]
MYKILWLAIFGGLVGPSIGTQLGSDILMRMNKQAMELVCQSQKGLLQDVMKAIEIPDFSSGGILSISSLNITKLKIDTVDILNLSVELKPESKIQLAIDASLHLKAKILHDDLELKQKVAISADVDFSKVNNGCPALSTSACKTVLGKLQLILSGVNSISLKLLQKHVHDILHGQLCLQVSNIFGLLNVQLGAFSALTMFSPKTQLQYILSDTPVVTNEFIDFNVNIVFSFLGKVLNFASGLAPLDVPFPAQIISSVPTLNLILSETVFKFLYTTLQKSGVLNCEIIGRKVHNVNRLTTAALNTITPEINKNILTLCHSNCKS